MILINFLVSYLFAFRNVDVQLSNGVQLFLHVLLLLSQNKVLLLSLPLNLESHDHHMTLMWVSHDLPL